MTAIRAVVHGAAGRMGQEVLAALCKESGVEAAGAVELQIETDSLPLPDGTGSVPYSSNLEDILIRCHPDVLVDFTGSESAMSAARTSAMHRVNLVIGTTGLSTENLNEIEQLANNHSIGAIVAPNFALGAIIMIHLAKIAARFFDYAEIIELHHDKKADAPSGTALSTGRAMIEARDKPFSYCAAQKEILSSRGGQLEGIAYHSIRLPGLMAHQEIIFGAAGQTLKIRHDTINRECYMPGVMLAVKEVVKRKGLVYGLDTLLGL